MGFLRRDKPPGGAAPLYSIERGNLRKMILGFSAFGFVYTVLCVVFGLAAAAKMPGLEKADNAMAMLLLSVPAPGPRRLPQHHGCGGRP